MAKKKSKIGQGTSFGKYQRVQKAVDAIVFIPSHTGTQSRCEQVIEVRGADRPTLSA